MYFLIVGKQLGYHLPSKMALIVSNLTREASPYMVGLRNKINLNIRECSRTEQIMIEMFTKSFLKAELNPISTGGGGGSSLVHFHLYVFPCFFLLDASEI